MREALLKIIHCPRCMAAMRLIALEENGLEVRRGRLICENRVPHEFEVRDGIVRFAAGFNHEAVQRELDYENSTYVGSERLTDPAIIADFPDRLAELWPHTCHFGPDFRALLDSLPLRPGMWVVNIGTGPCWSTRLIAERGVNAIALDVNDANFYGLQTSDILFQKHGIHFERILESMTHLPFRAGSIDHITFNAAFHHTPDMKLTLNECWRVLKPGGKLAMVNEEFVSIRHAFAKSEPCSDTGSHHAIPYSEFEETVRESGFKLEYRLASHIREKFRSKLPGGISDAVAGSFEAWPFLIKQLNSALIILSKPGGRRTSETSIREPAAETVSA